MAKKRTPPASAPKTTAVAVASKTRKKKTPPKTPAKAAPVSTAPRKLKKPTYQSFKLQKRIKHSSQLPSSFRIFVSSLKILLRHWRLFVLIAIVYGLIMFVLVGGTGNRVDSNGIKEAVKVSTNGKNVQLISGVTIFGALIGSATTAAQGAASAYVTVLFLMVSLAIIWALRELQVGNAITLRDAFYKGMRPIVPFILVLLVMFFQLFPLMFGSFFYNIAVNSGLFKSFVEQAIVTIPFFLMAVLSLYMISSSIFALYIVTLPDMTPMAALKAARKLVNFRRFEVMRKVFVLPFIFIVIAAVIMLPIIYIIPAIASTVFFALTILALIVFHSYMYTLYRSLLV